MTYNDLYLLFLEDQILLVVGFLFMKRQVPSIVDLQIERISAKMVY